MGKRKIPGLSKSKGMQSMIVLFPSGQYVLEITKHTEKESFKGTSMNHAFTFKAVEALDELNKEYEGKSFTLFKNEMLEDHPSFEEWGHIFTDMLASMFHGTGITIPKSDSVDINELVGASFLGTVIQRDEKDAEGSPVKRNDIVKYEAID